MMSKEDLRKKIQEYSYSLKKEKHVEQDNNVNEEDEYDENEYDYEGGESESNYEDDMSNDDRDEKMDEDDRNEDEWEEDEWADEQDEYSENREENTENDDDTDEEANGEEAVLEEAVGEETVVKEANVENAVVEEINVKEAVVKEANGEEVHGANDSDTSKETDSLSSKDSEPTLFHIFNNNPYFHKPTFGNSINISEGSNVTFSIFSYIICNNTYRDPYITFLLQYNEQDEMLKLPEFEYVHAQNINATDQLKNLCFEKIFPIFQVNPSTLDNSHIKNQCAHAFKGIFYKPGEAKGYIGIDAQWFLPYLNTKNSSSTTLSDHFHKTSYSWGCVDEILVNKKINSMNIDPRLSAFLVNHDWIYKIFNENDEPTQIPKILFAVNHRNHRLLRTKNSEFGHVILFRNFSSSSSSSSSSTMKRFVVYPSFSFQNEDETFYGIISTDCVSEI